MTRKKRKFLFDHFIFSIEAGSFFILWGFLFLPLILYLVNATLDIERVFTAQWQVALAIYTLIAVFIFIAAKRFFNENWWRTLIYTLSFSSILSFVVEFIYKTILFFVTINLV